MLVYWRCGLPGRAQCWIRLTLPESKARTLRTGRCVYIPAAPCRPPAQEMRADHPNTMSTWRKQFLSSLPRPKNSVLHVSTLFFPQAVEDCRFVGTDVQLCVLEFSLLHRDTPRTQCWVQRDSGRVQDPEHREREGRVQNGLHAALTPCCSDGSPRLCQPGTRSLLRVQSTQ